MLQNGGQTLYHDDLDFDITPYWRESTITEIKSAISTYPCTYVSGKRGVGKSWMLKRIARDLLNDGHFVVYYRLPRMRIANIGQVIEGVANRFAIATESADEKKLKKDKAVEILKIWSDFFIEWGAKIAQMPNPASKVGASLAVLNSQKLARFDHVEYEGNSIDALNECLSGFVKCLEDGNKHLVIILDQVERVNEEKRNYLNDIIEKRPKGVRYVFSSYYARDMIFDCDVGKYFCLSPLEIENLTNDEIQELIRDNGLLDSEDAGLILDYANGSTERAGYCIWLRKRCGKITRQDIKLAGEQYCKDQIARVKRDASKGCLRALRYIAVIGEQDCPSIGHLREYLKLDDISLESDIIDHPTFCDLLVKWEKKLGRKRTICFGYRDKHLWQCFERDARQHFFDLDLSEDPTSMRYPASLVCSAYAEASKLGVDKIPYLLLAMSKAPFHASQIKIGEPTTVIGKIHNSAVSYHLKMLGEPEGHSINELILAMSEAPFHAREARSKVLTEYIESFIEFELNTGNIEEAKANLNVAKEMFAQQGDFLGGIETLVRVSDICSRQDKHDLVNPISRYIAELSQPLISSDKSQESDLKQTLDLNKYTGEASEVTSIHAYLGGLGYPAAKQDLIVQAQQNHAPDEVIKILNGVQDGSFKSPADVGRDLIGFE